MIVPKETKLPFHWSSAVPKKYKRNVINGELHRAKKISSNFELEKRRILTKFKTAGYPIRFINSVIRSFENREEEQIIPNWLFEEEKKFVVRIQIPFCAKNEQTWFKVKKRIESYSEDSVKVEVTWKTRKIKSLFPLKDKVEHKSSVIYEGTCSCGDKYIGETRRNAKIRWLEHDKMSGKSEPSKHIINNVGHAFKWKIIANAPLNGKKKKTLEAFFIMKLKPKINDQLDIRFLRLFKNGIT